MQITEKLYYSDPDMTECTATVIDCIETDGKYKLVLDKTCMFPEGGGQPSDKGAINGVEVTDVREEDNIIYHVVDKPVKAGMRVNVKIDRDRRLDHNCQHTGEHMLSGIAKDMFGAVNVGFHMADDYSTLDFDMLLSDDDIHRLEEAANAAVRANTSIHCDMVNAEELSKLKLRKKTDGLEQKANVFRIVYIDGVDSCTCCGSHCNSTGEVGIVKINAWQKYKSGIRIWFLCGKRALDDYREKQAITDALSKRFSTKQENVLNAVIRQGDENAQLKRILREKTNMLVQLRSKELYAQAEEIRGVKLVILLETGIDAQELRLYCEELVSCGKVLCMAFSCCGDELYYALAASGGITPTMDELCKTVNALLNAKGGGRGDFVQGKARCSDKSGIKQSLEQLEAYIKNAINR